ncbi:transcriptional repressor LexA [Kiloniella laminariae]|uniref:transcriptional repressor LexA n=1 Tax=Kiloniella laminariae TaxID=454162 RepID=UPI00037224C3|nr:transcriptional repressor LexA [Kiloniella laminariae]
MLTKKQRELLIYIRDHLSKTGVSPSFDEMKDALSLKSKSGIHRLVTALEERGFIRRLAHRARAVEILKLPEDLASTSAQPHSRTAVRNPLLGTTVEAANQSSQDDDTLQIPLYGKIAAGTPIEALSDPSSYLDVPFGLIGTGDHYALTVEGDSMIEAGILDGDTVLIQRCDVIENGQIGVAFVDNTEATLKHVRRNKGRVELIPANALYESKSYESDRVQVQGKLVGLLRKYH